MVQAGATWGGRVSHRTEGLGPSVPPRLDGGGTSERSSAGRSRDDRPVPYEQARPRCGETFTGDDKEVVADWVVEHARAGHHHRLDREIVLAHLEGVHPCERDG